MSTALVKYDAARQALAEAHRIDEVKSIHDKAVALAAYARQAKDTEMLFWVTEIKVRAERRTGELLSEMPKHKGAATPLPKGNSVKKLSEHGISRKQSHHWQQLAKIPEPQFDQRIKGLKDNLENITTKKVLAKDPTPKPWQRDVAVNRLHHVITRELDGWPKEQRKFFADELRVFAERVLTG